MNKRRQPLRLCPGILIPGIIICIFIALALLAPFLSPYDYNKTDMANRLAGISWSHIFGTDECGRDIFTRILYGGRISLLIGICVPLISTALGTLFGMFAGYGNKIFENILMRTVDAFLAFPSVLMMLLFMFIFGGGMVSIILALSLAGFPWTARIAYSETLKVKGAGYVEAAVIAGVSKRKIIFRHIFPNIRKSILVSAILMVPTAIISESTISFLGFGMSSQPSWGSMVEGGRQFLFTHPEVSLVPCAAIILITVSFNILGKQLDRFYG